MSKAPLVAAIIGTLAVLFYLQVLPHLKSKYFEYAECTTVCARFNDLSKEILHCEEDTVSCGKTCFESIWQE